MWKEYKGTRGAGLNLPQTNLVVSLNKGTPIPQNTIVLIIGTPKMVPLIMGNPHLDLEDSHLAVSVGDPARDLKGFEFNTRSSCPSPKP